MKLKLLFHIFGVWSKTSYSEGLYVRPDGTPFIFYTREAADAMLASWISMNSLIAAGSDESDESGLGAYVKDLGIMEVLVDADAEGELLCHDCLMNQIRKYLGDIETYKTIIQ